MGAAGYVHIYDREKVEKAYANLWPDFSITDDWWYLDTTTATLDGKRWIFDYADDQGNIDGIENAFWFKGDWLPPDEALAWVQERYPETKYLPWGAEKVSRVVKPRTNHTPPEWGEVYVMGQVRVLYAIQHITPITIEVWT